MIENKTENKEIMEQESPTTETPEMTAEVNTEATEDVIVEAGAVCDEADEIIVDEAAEENGEDELVVEAAPVRKGMRRRSIALIAAIICMLAVAVGGTYAYFNDSHTTVNVISMRGLDLVLHEEDELGNQWGTEKTDENGNKWREVNGVMPSNSIWKRVYVENFVDLSKLEDPTDEEAVAAAKAAMADFYTRIRVTMRVEDANGEEIDAEDYKNYITINFNDKAWTYAPDAKTAAEKAEKGEELLPKDYWYHYNDIVKPGEITENLFTYVTFDKTMPNAYQNAKVYIDLEAQATQVKHNGTGALDAAW